jgi:TolB-like protein
VTDPAAVRAALARILASERFQNCEALARLLGLAVERSLAGRRFKVKAAQAVQLRARLSAYYAGEGMRDPVRIGLPEDGSPAVFSTAAPPGPPPARRPWVWLAAALVAAVPVSWAGAKWHARVVSAQIRSLVVLPFADLTPQDNGQWLAASFTGETIDALDRVTGLRVVGRTSAFKAKGDAGRELDVAAVLQGAVRQTGERLRISLEMVRTSDGYHLWSASFDRPAQDLRSAQQAISSAVAARLNVRLPAARTGRHQPPAPAYDAYLQGRYFFDQGTPDALNNSPLSGNTAWPPAWRGPIRPCPTRATPPNARWRSTPIWAMPTWRWASSICNTTGTGPPPKPSSTTPWQPAPDRPLRWPGTRAGPRPRAG